jgi:hypothetical protein
MITTTVLAFVFFSLTGMPIAFALGMAGMAGILVGGFPMVQLAGKVVYSTAGSASQRSSPPWAFPAFPARPCRMPPRSAVRSGRR